MKSREMPTADNSGAATSPVGIVPDVMPIDREEWRRQLNLSNFINTYYQYRDLQALAGVKRVLIVGPGQGLEKEVLKWRGYDIVTLDIDETFEPDVIGSVHDLSMFSSGAFDAVIASHVLEHLPIRYLDTALSELARVASYAVIYLPVTGRPAQLRIKPGFLGIDWSLVFDFFNYFVRPQAERPRFCGGQHYWEVGRYGFTHRKVVERLSVSFEVLSAYRNRDWLPSMNYVLRSRAQNSR